MKRLHPRSAGLAFGLVWGFGVFFGTLWLVLTGRAHKLQNPLGQLYLGYTYSVAGAVTGLLWGLVDGFLGGWLYAKLYNAFLPPERPEPVGNRTPREQMLER